MSRILAVAAAGMLLAGSARGAEIERLSGRKVKGKILKETEAFVTIEIRLGRDGRAVMNIPAKDIHIIRDADGKRRVLNEKAAAAPRPAVRRVRESAAKKPPPPPAFVGFRMDGTGRYPDATPPTNFSATQNVAWSTNMPSRGNSSPILVGGRLFVLAEPDILVCVDARSGRILWQKGGHASAAQGRARTNRDNGYASTTPASDGRLVYAVFGQGVVAAYDLNGVQKWVKFIETPKHQYGTSASPVAVEGKVIVQFNETLRALAAADGSEVWTARASFKWGTPTPYRIGNVEVIIHPSGTALSISDGKVVGGRLGNLTYSSPVLHEGIAYFIDERGGSAFRMQGAQSLWTNSPPRNRYYASALYHDGIVYGITRRGVFSAWDAKTGAQLYTQQLNLGRGANAVYPSPTLGGKYIFVGGIDGTVQVIAPGRTYREVARNKVEKFRSSPVFDGGRIYLRGEKKLWCLGR